MFTTIGKLFDIEYGQKDYHNKEWLEGTEGANILISSKGDDNGIFGFFDIKDYYHAPVITVPSTGTVGQAFVQEKDCSVDWPIPVSVWIWIKWIPGWVFHGVINIANRFQIVKWIYILITFENSQMKMGTGRVAVIPFGTDRFYIRNNIFLID